MIVLKSAEELVVMERAGEITAQVIREVLARAEPGVNTWDLDQFADKRICELGGEPGFKRVDGYDFATCINVNEGLVHGIPTRDLVIKEGDIVSVDLGAFYEGFHTDSAWTKLVKSEKLKVKSYEERGRFLDVGEEALGKAIAQCRVGNFVGDISETIQSVVEGAGFSVIRDLVGHGVGRELHEDPQIPCFGVGGEGPQLVAGMVLAIEVLYARGSSEIEVAEDGWTVVTKDRSLAATFEKTVAITEAGVQMLTKTLTL